MSLDLVRLATSIQLAPHPAVDPRHAANAVLRGYREGLEDPQPALLFEGQTWMRPYAEPAKGKPEKFWNDVDDYEEYAPPPRIARALIDKPAQWHRQEEHSIVPPAPQGWRQPRTAALRCGRLLARRPGVA